MFDEFRAWLLLWIIFLVVVYGFIYTALGSDHLNSFGDSPIDGWYFALTTSSTVGYGDITPKTPLSKLVIMTQQFLTLFVSSILVLSSITSD